MSFQVICGDALAVLRTLPDESVHCCVTSPPYWGLRDYGVPRQLGLESTPELYVAHIVEVFREVWRVLRGDGTLWCNLGDCYATGAGRVGNRPGGGDRGTAWADGVGPMTQPNRMPLPGLKPKNMVGMPWRVAFALQAHGWYLRSDIIWHKPNPMPESVTDRPTKAHEYVFLLAKSERYFYDAAAIQEPATDTGRINGRHGRIEEPAARPPGSAPRTLKRIDYSARGRNKRTVWTITTEPFSEAHFATFPQELARPCVLAGCPVFGTVLDPFCGSGTAGVVALGLGRQFLGIELSPIYAAMARRRIEGDQPLFNDQVVHASAVAPVAVG